MTITVYQSDIDYAAEKSTTIYIDDVEATDGMQGYIGQTFKITNDLGPFVDNGTYYSYRRDFANQKEYFNYSADKMTGTFDITSSINSGDVVIELDVESLDVDADLIQKATNNNLTILRDGEVIDTPTTLMGGVIEFKCNEGFIFGDGGNEVRLDNFDGYRDLDLSDDKKIASTTIDHGFVEFFFNVVVDESEQGVDVVGYNNLYSINKEIYNEIQNQRFVAVSGEDEFDYGVYILKTLEFPFTLPEDYIGEDDFIRLATYKLQAKAPIVKNNEVVLDLGSVVVPEKYGDGRDYSNVSATLYLPYNGSTTLDIQQCMGATLGIKYYVSLYDGNAVAVVSSDKTGETIFSNSFNLGFEIQITQAQDLALYGALSNARDKNDVYTPFVEVHRQVPVDDGNIYTNLIPVFGNLENTVGYVEVENIRITGNINYDEKQQLESIAKNGMHING